MSIFNVGDLLAQIRAVVDKAVTAVQSVFLFTLLAGLTLLLAAVQASREERLYETAILRVLGARRAMILASVLAEFACCWARWRDCWLRAARRSAAPGWRMHWT